VVATPCGRQRQYRTFLGRHIGTMLNAMKPFASRRTPIAMIALAAAALAAATGLVFASWVEHGAKIFLAMTEAGIAWCF
jgi:hypothetical protein